MFQCRRALGITSVFVLLLLSHAGAAHAQSQSGEYTLGMPESDPTKERLRMTLPKGRVLVQGFIEMNLSTDLAFKPVSVAPDVWYGVLDELSVGLAHSANAMNGFYGGVGSSLCLTGDENGCDGVYRTVGLLARYNLIDTGMALAVNGGLLVSGLDPFRFGIQLGVAGRWEYKPIAVVFQPSIYVGLTAREGEGETNIGGNGELITLPVAALYDVMPALAVGLQTGVTLGLDDVASQWNLFLSLGGRYEVMPGIWAELAFSLPAVATGQENGPGAFDTRVITLGGGTIF
jgi:hypothetical protein